MYSAKEPREESQRNRQKEEYDEDEEKNVEKKDQNNSLGNVSGQSPQVENGSAEGVIRLD